MSTLRALSIRTALAASLALALGACSAYRAARVVDLDDVPSQETVRRLSAADPGPLFVDTTGALVAKRQLKTTIHAAPPLQDFLRGALEDGLGVPVDDVRVEFVGHVHAYYFPSRHDDLLLRARVESTSAGIAGTYEVRIRGNESPDWLGPIDEHWVDLVPDTGAGLEEDEGTRRLERRADQVAWMQRGKLIELTRRLVAAVSD